jgi:hypothetical protein
LRAGTDDKNRGASRLPIVPATIAIFQSDA